MKKIYYFLALLLLTSAFVSCSEDDLGDSIFTTDRQNMTEFDAWLKKNYTDPYNIRVIYRYQDYETDQLYNVIPAKMENVKALAIMMRHLWIDAYNEVMKGDSTFMKTYCPRIFQFIGSAEYKSDGSMVLGTAEGGLKITMFRLNSLDVNNVFIDSESPFPNAAAMPMDMNFWFFHTMHHEFCHILHQTKNYSTDWNLVSMGDYQSANWINIDDPDAPAMGFVTAYASGEEREDFADLYATYVTHTPEAWEKILAADTTATHEGRDAIEAKLAIMKDYCRTNWNFELDSLRKIVLRRSEEVKSMDLKTLN